MNMNLLAESVDFFPRASGFHYATVTFARSEFAEPAGHPALG